MYSVVLLMAMTGTPDTAAFGHRHGCDGGGCQGCYGGGCTGYEAGCCGCHGGGGRGKKHRGHGCSGGCSGCSGGCMGYSAGCCGCMGGCMGCYGGVPYGAPMTAPPPTTTPPVKGAMFAAPATVVVSLPADATLKVDGVATQSTTELRTFATPVLPVGQAYHYTLTAAVVRDGQTLTATQQITVQAGVTSRIELPATAFGTAVAAN